MNILVEDKNEYDHSEGSYILGMYVHSQIAGLAVFKMFLNNEIHVIEEYLDTSLDKVSRKFRYLVEKYKTRYIIGNKLSERIYKLNNSANDWWFTEYESVELNANEKVIIVKTFAHKTKYNSKIQDLWICELENFDENDEEQENPRINILAYVLDCAKPLTTMFQ